MKLHANARTCPNSRKPLVRRIEEESWSLMAAAEAAGISERSARKWLARWRNEGEAGLLDRSSAPKRIPHRTPRAGRQGDLRPAAAADDRGGDRRGPRPGALHGLAVAAAPRPRQALGWECVHVCVDDATRLAYVEVLPDERGETAVGFLRRAVAWLAERGVRVERVMTDNGSPYRSVVHARACRELGIRHLRTRPYRPRTNGKAERFIQTMLREWAYGRIYGSSAERSSQLAGWLARSANAARRATFPTRSTRSRRSRGRSRARRWRFR
ncbi:MAG TPA: leucine zipper domain-containing protein [Solirubrobacterales bacterium]|nr:leucine zipper domain-containing protein [Solirubrobacterales bacterium]